MNEELKTKAIASVEPTAGTMTEAIRRGVVAGGEVAAAMWPVVTDGMTKTLCKALYGTCYYVAFGATFGALAVASVLPKDGVLEKGLHDGAKAARETFHRREAPDQPAAAEETLVTAPAL